MRRHVHAVTSKAVHCERRKLLVLWGTVATKIIDVIGPHFGVREEARLPIGTF